MIEQDNLKFYNIMHYPIPKQSDFFLYKQKKYIKEKFDSDKFSRKTKNPYMDKFIQEINKHGKLYKSLPFISEIFLCNSITFNALKQDSDIDLFIIAKKNSIWRARFFSVLFFTILGLKRSKTNKKGKFCLSFYITEDYKDLSKILLKDTQDIYLPYRIIHLVPLYQETKNTNIFYKSNKRLSSIFPNHDLDFHINIGCDNFYGSTKLKVFIEKLYKNNIGTFFENLIKKIRTPILEIKVKKLGVKGKQIVINNNILKFHDDKRYSISKKFEKYFNKNTK